MDIIKAGGEAAATSITKVVQVMNLLPSMIRENSIFTSKVIAVNMQALTDVMASEANPKKPPVTKDNMAIIKFLSDNQPKIYAALLEHAKNTKDMPPEKRAYELLVVNNAVVKPIIRAAK